MPRRCAGEYGRSAGSVPCNGILPWGTAAAHGKSMLDREAPANMLSRGGQARRTRRLNEPLQTLRLRTLLIEFDDFARSLEADFQDRPRAIGSLVVYDFAGRVLPSTIRNFPFGSRHDVASLHE